MKTVEINLNSNILEYNDYRYDCELLITRDIDLIIQEAERSHKGVIDEMYDRNTLRQNKARLFTDDNGSPFAIIIIYIINYKNGKGARYACGDYYIVYSDSKLIYPHPYQASICW